MENDMLSSLLSDPESLQNAMKTVSDLLGGQQIGRVSCRERV